jgi:hypothetical protein
MEISDELMVQPSDADSLTRTFTAVNGHDPAVPGKQFKAAGLVKPMARDVQDRVSSSGFFAGKAVEAEIGARDPLRNRTRSQFDTAGVGSYDDGQSARHTMGLYLKITAFPLVLLKILEI